MSGRQIGSALGFVVGMYFGNPQLGMMIGGMVGGAISPDKVQGAKIGELPVQRSLTGGVQPVVLGTSLVDQCLVMWAGKPRIVKEKESAGKGGGPVVVNEVMYQDYRIRVCRSSAADGSTVQGFPVIFEDGRLVYDARPNPRISAADSAKWAQNVTFYYGGAAQEPDPTEEADVGVGNASAHRQIASFVKKNQKMTDFGNRIPTYEVVVSKCGIAKNIYEMARVEWNPATQNDPTAGDVVQIGDSKIMFRGSKNAPAGTVSADTFVGYGDWYWESTTGWLLRAGSLINHFGWSGIIRQSDGATAGVLRHSGSNGVASGTLMGADILLYPGWVPTVPEEPKFARVRNRLTFSDGFATWSVAIDDGAWETILTEAGVFAPFATSRGTFEDGGTFEKQVFIYSVSDDFLYAPPEGSLPLGVAKALALGPTSIEIPDSPSYYIDPITGGMKGPADVGELCSTSLAEIVRYICERGQLTDAELYLEQLEGIAVRGITLQSAGTCKDELDPLRQTHFFDPADFDGKLRFRMRGATDVDMVIDPDSLVLTDDEDEDNRIIGQEVEFSRKHWFNYLSLDLDYLRTGAPSERTALDPSVVGESESQANEVFSHEEAMRIAAIQHRLLWMGQEGYRKFGLPLEYLELTGASLISLDGRRGRIDGYSIDLNAIWFDPVPYDRGSAYVANVVAPVLTPPTGPGTTIRGPTISAVLNMPVLRDADDRAGVIWAATGPSAGWRGARLELSRAGSTYDVGPTIDRACTMGILAEALPAASRYGLDTTNALKIKLYPGARDLDGRTFEQLIASDDNALAIRYPDGTVELLQFMTAVETAEREYTLTGLLRGRKDTTAGTHLADAMVVLLDNNVRFIALRPEDVGATINFRATSLETDPDLAEVQAVTLTTIESLREWTPYAVSLDSDGSGGYCVTWIGRARLGSSLMPVQSANFRDFAVTFAEGGDTLMLTTPGQALCQTQAQLEAAFGVGFATPTVTVTAKSRIHSSFDSAAGAP